MSGCRKAIVSVAILVALGPQAGLSRAQTVPPAASSSPPPAVAQPATSAQRVLLEDAVTTASASEAGPLATPELLAWLNRMIHDNLPETYEDDRKWNQQKEVWDGIKIWREGLRIETKRKKKMVNAGTWTRYSIELVDPDQTVQVQFHRLETLPDGKIAFGVTVDCQLDIFGRLSQWVRDVQLVSISANADANCRLTLDGTVEFQMNILRLPPDIVIKPHIDRAHVELTHYRVRRVSQIGGDTAKFLGNSMRGVVDEKLADLNGKLAGKINTQLEKKSDKLHFSPQFWLLSRLPMPGNTAALATP
ncbi:hypothetical protein [Aureliella helgolandensis]|nr:hypothetical protein [Aureliella helgolandensis]